MAADLTSEAVTYYYVIIAIEPTPAFCCWLSKQPNAFFIWEFWRVGTFLIDHTKQRLAHLSGR